MQTQCPHCKSRYRLSPEMVDAFGGFVRCGNCDYKFNVHDQVRLENDYFELSSEDALQEGYRGERSGTVPSEGASVQDAHRVEPKLDAAEDDDEFNIRFRPDEYEYEEDMPDSQDALSSYKIEPRFDSSSPDDSDDRNHELEAKSGQASDQDARIDAQPSDVDSNTEKAVRPDASVDSDQYEDAEPQIESEQVAQTRAEEITDSLEAETDTLFGALDENDAEPAEDEPQEKQRSDPDASLRDLDAPVEDAPDELDDLDDLEELEELYEEVNSEDLASEDSLPPDEIKQDVQTPLDTQAPEFEKFTFGTTYDLDEEDERIEPALSSSGLISDEQDEASTGPGFFAVIGAGLGRFIVFAFWLIIAIGLSYLLFGQMKDHLYPAYKQHPVVQKIRVTACGFIPCLESEYDVQQYEIVVSRMDEVQAPGRQLHISIFLLNKALHAQAYPRLQITLKRMDGSTAGQRVIEPDEYTKSHNNMITTAAVGTSVTKTLIKPNKLGKVLIKFDNPPSEAVGFEVRVAP